MTEGERVEFRDATADDGAFIREMATRFGRGDDPRVFENFGATPGDYGVVAGIEGERLGAAWYRRAFRSRIAGTEIDYGLQPPMTTREPFLAVLDEVEGNGYGGQLLDKLVEHAREDHGVQVLHAYPAHPRADEMLERRGFRPAAVGRWLYVSNR